MKLPGPASPGARAAWVLGACALVLAWHLRFVQDDAFISFGYARSWVEGDGLTWFGQRVEGYTNFLWVLWIALGLRLGADPVAWSQLGGLASFGAALVLLWRLSLAISGEAWTAALALLLFAGNATVLCYATGGLETMLQAALLLAVWVELYGLRADPAPAARAARLSLWAGAAVLTRPDSLLPAGIALLAAAPWLSRRRAGAGALLALAVPAALLVGGHLAWRLQYYGALLPNTFTAKVHGWPVAEGLVYWGRFLHWYALWPFLLLAAALNARGRGPARAPGAPIWPLVAALVAWLAYGAAVGGDFMEFRFAVPVAAPLFALLAHGITAARGPRARPLLAALCAAVLLAASARHALVFRGTTPDDALDSIETLASFYGLYADGDWGRIGSALARDLSDSDVLLASHATGAIPYYSRLATVDMFGLNDAQIARTGRRLRGEATRPGHGVHVTLPTLRERGVNLVIGHPVLTPDPDFGDPGLARWYPEILRHMVLGHREPIGTATLVTCPLEGGEGLLLWYLTPHPRVDALVRSGHWGVRRVDVPPAP